MKHLFLPLICLLVSTPVLSDTYVSTPPAQTANQQVSIEDIRKLIPAEVLPLITDKTLEYLKFVAETWPMLKGSEEEIETEGIVDQGTTTKTVVTTPLMPGVMQSTSNISGSLKMQIQEILSGCGNFSPVYLHYIQTEGKQMSNAYIGNIVAHEGQLFPLKVGNSEKISYLITTAKSNNVSKAPMVDNDKTIHENVATVMDQINGYSSDSFPFPVNGKIWVIALNSKSSAFKHVKFMYYSEELNSFIPLNRPEDRQTDGFSKSQKTLSFKLLN